MKKKLSSKRGFTLVECLVAIVIFSIMSLMVSMIYSMSIQQYKNSRQIDTDLSAQEEEIVLAEKYTSGSITPESGSQLEFGFKNLSGDVVNDRKFNYEAKKADNAVTDDSSLELNYVVAEGINYVDHVDGNNNPTAPGGSAVTDGDVRIYGSVGIGEIRIEDFTATGQTIEVLNGATVQTVYEYIIKLYVYTDDIRKDEDDEIYRSLKFAFPKSIYNVSISTFDEAIKISSNTIRVSGRDSSKNRTKLEGVNGEITFYTSDIIGNGLEGFEAYFGEAFDDSKDYLIYQTVNDPVTGEAVPGVYSYVPTATTP